jgi:hypothetical protein
MMVMMVCAVTFLERAGDDTDLRQCQALPLRAALSQTRLSGKHCPEQDKGASHALGTESERMG